MLATAPPKILPVGALLKYAFWYAWKSGFCSAFRLVGRGPLSLNAATWLSALVRKAASLAASSGYLLCAGTESHEPPQLPAPPGGAATSHLPLFSAPELSCTMPVIHDGHRVTAKVPFLKPALHSADQVDVLAVAFALIS